MSGGKYGVYKNIEWNSGTIYRLSQIYIIFTR